MIFCEDTKELILYTLRDMIVKIHPKNFGQHLLQICCSTNEFVKFDFIFFTKIVQYVKMEIFLRKNGCSSTIFYFWEVQYHMCLQKKYWWCVDKRHTQKSAKKIFSLKFQLIFYNLHGIECAWCTRHNVAILLPDVVYDINNKFW